MNTRILGGIGLIAAAAGGLVACGSPAGKEEMLGVCSARLQGGAQTCGCIIEKFETGLAEADFKTLANAVYENRVFSGDWIPERMHAHPTIGPVVREANAACIRS